MSRRWTRTITYLMIIATLIGIVLIALSVIFTSTQVVSQLFAAFGACVLTIGTVSLLERRIVLKEFMENYELLGDKVKTGIDRVYPAHSTHELQGLKETLLHGATREIKLLGYTFPDYALQYPKWRDELRTKAEAGVKITILLMKPKCQMMLKRCEDETKDDKPLYVIGAEQSPDVLKSFMDLKDSIKQTHRNNMEIRVFENYPTTNLQIYDDKMLVYWYGYRLAGTGSPFLLFTRTKNSTTEYYDEHFSNVYQASVEATREMLQ